jgi:F0F1-type ATP synthase assembly protein I
MALDNHPNVFRYEGKLWVSELPREQMRAQFVEQRAWDATHVKSERWTVALVIGAILGTGITFLLGEWGGIAPALYLFLLPIGFAFGVILAAVVNRRIVRAVAAPPQTPRPVLTEVTRIPSAVARKVDDETPVSDLIEWSKKGFVPGN